MKFQTLKLPVPAVYFRSASRTRLLFGLLALGALVLPDGAPAQSLPTNYNATVPVYEIIQAGATGTQASNLAGSLNIPAAQLALSNGLVGYINPGGFLTFPTNGLTNVPIISNLVSQTSNQYPAIPIGAVGINLAALSNLTVLSDSAASNAAGNALSNAGLSPQFGTPLVDHAMFTALSSNANPNGGVTLYSNTLPLDTAVEYQFTDPNGYPILGPGEQVQFNFSSNGSVTRLLYSACQLSPQRETQLMSKSQASNLVASLFPPGAQINIQAVYWVPPFSPTPVCSNCPPPTWNPTTVIPWYYCTATLTVTNSVIGAAATVSTVPLMAQLIPATFDTNYVPAPILSLSTNGTNVNASVSVTGGTPPYSYLWGGSSPNVTSNTGDSITYTPIIRVGVPSVAIMPAADGSLTISWPYPSDGFILQSTPSLSPINWTQCTNEVESNAQAGVNIVRYPPTPAAEFFRLALTSPTVPVTETVKVTVTDANGVSVPAVQSIAAQAAPIEGGTQDPAIDYGCESPYDPGLGSTDRANWLTGMSGSGGGSQRFCWTGSAAWPGDFIEPVTPGVLGAGPWTIGDADYQNWGVNTACIVLYIGHGNPGLITFTIYGNEQSINTCGYVTPQSLLFEGYDQETLGLAVGLPPSCGAPWVGYNVPNYIDSWRNGGPTVNDNLYWLSLLSCNVLQEYDSSTPPVGAWTRWGPGFNNLHILTGFDSRAEAETGFPKQYADNMLVSSETIVQAWISAAHTKGTGTAAALGPIGPDGIWDYNDHYWGKGAVGASIPANLIQGWWYIMWPWTAPVAFP
jgi:hypothetical protein